MRACIEQDLERDNYEEHTEYVDIIEKLTARGSRTDDVARRRCSHPRRRPWSVVAARVCSSWS